MNITARCTIRLAEDDDLLGVLSVHSRLEAAGQPRRSAADEERQTWARMMAMPELAVYVAECDNDVVGTATLMTMPNVTYRCPHGVHRGGRGRAPVQAAGHRHGHARSRA